MSLVLTNKQNKVTMGYISFGIIRMNVAKAYSKDIGELYRMMYSPFFTGYSEEEQKYFNNHLPECLDKFLFHSDCGGYLYAKDVKSIYKELLKLDVRLGSLLINNDINKKYKDMSKLFAEGKRIYFT